MSWRPAGAWASRALLHVDGQQEEFRTNGVNSCHPPHPAAMRRHSIVEGTSVAKAPSSRANSGAGAGHRGEDGNSEGNDADRERHRGMTADVASTTSILLPSCFDIDIGMRGKMPLGYSVPHRRGDKPVV